jgi:hypothetical protein
MLRELMGRSLAIYEAEVVRSVAAQPEVADLTPYKIDGLGVHWIRSRNGMCRKPSFS